MLHLVAEIKTYLHDKSLQRNSFIVVSVVVVELEVVMEYQGGLHIERHF